MLSLPMTEGNYMITFVGLLFDTLLRNDDNLEIMWYVESTSLSCFISQPYFNFFFCYRRGETKLKAAQNIDNDALDDGERRCSSTNIDGKITTTKANAEILLFEISGPPLVRDYLHFIGDRKKLALNMKKIIHDIINSQATGKKSLLFKIQIYGLHFYGKNLLHYNNSIQVVVSLWNSK